MQLHLGGHLSWYDPYRRARLAIKLAEPIVLLALLRQLNIPPAEIAIATVNRVAVALENAQVSDGDSVELFPPVGGGGASHSPL